MALDEDRQAGESGHLADHNALHDFYNNFDVVTTPNYGFAWIWNGTAWVPTVPAPHHTETANYTLVASDAAKVVEFNSSSALTLTVPPNASVAFPVGTVVGVARIGSGAVTVSPGSGVTLLSTGGVSGPRNLGNRYAEATIRKRASDTWVLSGDLA